MTERPILFSANMVRALLGGTKTQTRRALRIQPPVSTKSFCTYHHPDPRPHHFAFDGASLLDFAVPCPYGQPGDRLWVRETWAYGIHAMAAARNEDGPFVYAADGTTQGRLCDRWRPSIHMLRAASRILLEVTDVRIELLQDVSRQDALAEGIVHQPDGGYGLPDGEHYHYNNPCLSYLGLWEAINGTGSVESNPWVWVVEFKRVTS